MNDAPSVLHHLSNVFDAFTGQDSFSLTKIVPLSLWIFAAGLFSSISHCCQMCGPIVNWQMNRRLQNLDTSHITSFVRLKKGLLLPYHFGRLLTYLLLTTLLFVFKQTLLTVASLPFFRFLPVLLFSLMFVLFASLTYDNLMGLLKNKTPFKHLFSSFLSKKFSFPNFSILKKIPQTPFVAGLFFGFLPCGILYIFFGLTLSFEQLSLALFVTFSFWLGTAFPLAFLSACGALSARYRKLSFFIFFFLYLWGTSRFFIMTQHKWHLFLKHL